MSIIDDYLNDIRRNLSHLGLRERQAVLAEIEDHLRTETKRLRKEDTGLSADEAALAATHAFGDPKEIGVAYGAHGGVINRSTGELLLDVAILSTRAAGRGARGVLKWTGITVLSVLGVALIIVLASLLFAGTLINVFQDDIRENVPRPLYSYQGSWDMTDRNTEVLSAGFEVPDRAREFWFNVDIDPEGIGPFGCARVMLIAPDESVAYDSGTGCGAVSQTMVFNQKGSWKVSYQFVAFEGSVAVDAIYFTDVLASR